MRIVQVHVLTGRSGGGSASAARMEPSAIRVPGVSESAVEVPRLPIPADDALPRVGMEGRTWTVERIDDQAVLHRVVTEPSLIARQRPGRVQSVCRWPGRTYGGVGGKSSLPPDVADRRAQKIHVRGLSPKVTVKKSGIGHARAGRQ